MDLDFKKGKGLVPAIIQDDRSDKVLMLGYMNREALEITKKSGKVTFYSRSQKKLWTKGETSGNYLHVREIREDCDADTLLIRALPDGPVCHTGDDTCFGDTNPEFARFLEELERIIADRKKNPQPASYTKALFEKGTAHIARKVGEEALEVVIEALGERPDLLKEEIADLLYHLLVLMADRQISLNDINLVLKNRHRA
ncbi:MAG: bifunctional phosphoribosyl-AMP cyclohydrolase/phosphoribosyl-ATP diphosphatase HisIE [Candidatus Neomarinimicrobiota bacterium]|jgi:phosphoribosyl-ATP pyrophosphohydrolase/phosphoribosyl-AMP cyclohydrolase|nr:bifunctional phosphoribosyl-AMP cyclohydrolase/phosphoribosyl-ATP diphosphatase HisIE [Candidatus Neomarinimicrobiota bacterium]MDX9780362.1 bifunctional phosphoribosyl-AMP cyclohydrolase/phosphoribosyl-ATP diphosphatase HisIE [bacterium]